MNGEDSYGVAMIDSHGRLLRRIPSRPSAKFNFRVLWIFVRRGCALDK
jgi:hypothetical protein